MPSLQSRVFRSLLGLGGRRALETNADVQARRAFVARATWYMRPPPGTRVAPVDAGGVRAEWVVAAGARTDAALLYVHGGAWVLGYNHQYRRMIGWISRASRVQALAIDYRLAPEHPFPAALDDCLATYRWLRAQGIAPERTVIGGDSAGGNLTLATLLALRDAGEPLPAAAVCLSPATDLAGTGESYRTRAQVDPILRPNGARAAWQGYVGDADPRAPLLSPLYGDLRGLPPLLIQVGEDEILLSDSTRFAERAEKAGVCVRLEIGHRMWHDWQIMPDFPEARQAIASIGAFVCQHVS